MAKKLVSIVLTLSIVATLFAGLSFNTFANETEVAVTHTVSVKIYSQVVATYQVAHGEAFDRETAKADIMARFPERFPEGSRLYIKKGNSDSVTQDMELGTYYEYRVRFYGINNAVLFDKWIAAGGSFEIPDAEVEGRTFIGWDKEVVNSNVLAAADYYAQYEVSTENVVTHGYVGAYHTTNGKQNNSVISLTNAGYDPTKSLIRDTANTDAKVYYYVSSAADNPTVASSSYATVYGERKQVNADGVDKLTGIEEYAFTNGTMPTISSTSSTGARPIIPTKLSRVMFVDRTGSEIQLVDDEEKQYVQINFKLDAKATIDSFVTTDSLNRNPTYAKYKNTYGHFKVYVADTEDGLWDETNCVAEVRNDTVGENYEYLGVNLANPVQGSWVGLKIISAYASKDLVAQCDDTNLQMRVAHFGVHGTYVNPINAEGLSVTVETEGDLPETLVKKSDAVYGRADKSGKYGACYVTVTANKSYVDSANLVGYTFKGWYKGEDKVSDNLEYAYNLALGSANLVAKYNSGELDDSDMAVIPETVNEYKNKLNTVENLMQEGYAYGRTDHLTMEDAGTITCQANSRSDKIANPTDTSATLDLIDGNVSTNAELRGASFYEDNMQYVEGTYVDVIINLLHPTKLDALFVGLPANEIYRPSQYAIYISNSGTAADLMPDEKNGEDAETNRKVVFENKNNDQCQVFKFDEGTMAKYIGIRIYDPVANGKQSSATANEAYARLSEIGVFGEYDIAYYDYTLTSNTGNLVNESGKAYNGKNICFEAPLTKNGLSFVKFTVNGNDAEAIIDDAKNIATINTVVEANTNIVAVYENDPIALTSSKYAIKEGYVKLEKSELAFTLLKDFDQYKNNIKIKDGEKELQDHDYVTAGMKMELIANGEVANVYDVVYNGDYNGDKNINVTDIVDAVDAMVNGNATEKGAFSFDDGDGKFTVTDIVKVRKAIMQPSQETAAIDYSNKTIIATDLDYKAMGRLEEKTEGSILFRHAASGVVINANCYGDVIFNMTGTQFEYLTVVVDGVEHWLRTDYINAYDYVVAEDLEPGVHTIEIYRQEAQYTSTLLNSVKINGIILDAPKDKDILIEYIGDSITCGVGNNVIPPNTEYDGHSNDATKAYGRLTAKALDVDWSNVSVGGSTLCNEVRAGQMIMPENYMLNFLYGNNRDFENERKADIIVINLGTNDNSLSWRQGVNHADYIAKFEEQLYDFTMKLIELNGEDVKIVYAFGMMLDENESWVTASYKKVSQQLAEEGITVPYCQLPKNTKGAAGHPWADGQVAAAEVLTEFIKTNVLG